MAQAREVGVDSIVNVVDLDEPREDLKIDLRSGAQWVVEVVVEKFYPEKEMMGDMKLEKFTTVNKRCLAYVIICLSDE